MDFFDFYYSNILLILVSIIQLKIHIKWYLLFFLPQKDYKIHQKKTSPPQQVCSIMLSALGENNQKG